MDTVRVEIYRKWDRQSGNDFRARSDESYILLNNLYLMIERGEWSLDIHTYNRLRELVDETFLRSDPMHEWWTRELERLPGWEMV